MLNRRKLGLTEAYSKFCHEYADGTTNGVFMAQISGPLSVKVVKEGFRLMQERHDVLRAHFADSVDFDYIEIDEKARDLPFSVIERAGSEQWIDIVEQNLQNKYTDPEKYLWSATFITDGDHENAEHDIIIAVQHSIFDGVSALAFINELAQYFVRIYQDEKIGIKISPLLPPVEELLEKKISWSSFLLKMIASSAKYIKLRKHLFSYEKFVPFQERRAKNIYHEIDQNQLIPLIKKCKEEKTTITSLLVAACMTGAHRVLNNHKSSNQSKQVVYTNVNVRGKCQPEVSMSQLGCFVDIAETILSFSDDTSIWETARLYQEKFAKEVEKPGHMPVKFNKKIFSKMLASFDSGFLKQKYQYGIGVTNIGRLDDLLPEGPFELKKFHFCTSRKWGDWLMLVHVSTIGKKMYFCFCYAEPLLSKENANAIVKESIYILSSLAGKEKNEFTAVIPELA